VVRPTLTLILGYFSSFAANHQTDSRSTIRHAPRASPLFAPPARLILCPLYIFIFPMKQNLADYFQQTPSLNNLFYFSTLKHMPRRSRHLSLTGQAKPNQTLLHIPSSINHVTVTCSLFQPIKRHIHLSLFKTSCLKTSLKRFHQQRLIKAQTIEQTF